MAFVKKNKTRFEEKSFLISTSQLIDEEIEQQCQLEMNGIIKSKAVSAKTTPKDIV
jgi:hypothetical protein